ncbi:MAG: hypothetical protein IPG39_20560 [Bacteroidetes bacterium]|nr:hypothetical protein [Bacteroidota bacterium]
MGLGNTKHMSCNNGEGQINTGRMMAHSSIKHVLPELPSLTVCAYEIQVAVMACHLHCEDGFTFSVKKVLVANNGFAHKTIS